MIEIDKKNSDKIRGIGLIWGIDVHNENLAKRISKKAFERG